MTDQNTSDTAATNAFLRKSRPKLAELETIRLAKLKAFQFRKKIAFPVGAVLTPFLGFIDYWLILLQRSSDDTAAGVTVAGLGALWMWVNAPKRQYAKAYKLSLIHI